MSLYRTKMNSMLQNDTKESKSRKQKTKMSWQIRTNRENEETHEDEIM